MTKSGDKPKTASVTRNNCDVTINEVGAGDDINTSGDDACKKPAVSCFFSNYFICTTLTFYLLFELYFKQLF